MTNANESAFPEISSGRGWDPDAEESFSEVSSSGGLTKREYFAAKAMQGMAAIPAGLDWSKIAEKAVKAADALLAELQRREMTANVPRNDAS